MIERKIIIGLITSTEFLQRIKSVWDPRLLESNVAKRLASWCWEYYDNYSKAPGKDIEGIFYSKNKSNKLPKETAEEIEQEILPGLSEESIKENFNLEYLLEESKKYLAERHLTIYSDNIQALLANGELLEAEKLVHEFRPLGTSTINLNDYILNTIQIKLKKRPKPTMLMNPWLREGQTTIIYGDFGVGKSLLTLLIGYLMGLKDYIKREAQIGKWQVKNPTGCLYIDGELGELELEDRMKKYEWIGLQQCQYRMKFLSLPEYQMATEDEFLLSKREKQLKIIEWLKTHPNYKLIVLDSVSTLFGLVDENSNSEWNNKVNPFLKDLRALNIACLLLHHSGKDDRRGVRGSSATGAMAHNIFKLSDHEGKQIDEGEAWFSIGKDKQRAAGMKFKTFSIHFTQTEDERETHFEITKNTND